MSIEAIVEFHKPQRPDPAKDYVLAPAPGQIDGWFPLGDISLVGGASGTGKTTLVFDMLRHQKQGYSVFGHKTFSRLFLVLALDRGEKSHRRTLDRMSIMREDFPTKLFYPANFGKAALQEITNLIEEMNPLPQIVFIDDMDFLVENDRNKRQVAVFMRGLRDIAEHYRIAIIGSVNASWMRYPARLADIEVWSQNCETVMMLEFANNDDGTAPGRSLTVLPRNAEREKFEMQFEHGRLLPVLPAPGRPSKALQIAIQYLQKALQYGPRAAKGLIRDAHDFENISRPTLFQAARILHINTTKVYLP